ncbi:hypothetical protein M785_07065 [Neisseria gonorrhoeae MU_NG20]|nr:hypothetical protein M739_02445 [Neisseria gonorrhoeae MIA_2011_05-16]KLT10440.1 hypothetical protein M785_07065 [Neisseria gonorrhoeae MU_NG20]
MIIAAIRMAVSPCFIIISFHNLVRKAVLIGIASLRTKINIVIAAVMCHAHNILIARQCRHAVTRYHRKINHRGFRHRFADQLPFFVVNLNIFRPDCKLAFIFGKVAIVLVVDAEISVSRPGLGQNAERQAYG